MGRYLRFDWNDVLEWLERNREKEPAEAWPGLRRFFACFKLDREMITFNPQQKYYNLQDEKGRERRMG